MCEAWRARAHSCVRHDVHVWDRYDSHMNVWDMTLMCETWYSCVRQTCVTWMCETYIHVWDRHDSHMNVWNMTHIWMCETWLTHPCVRQTWLTHECVRHDIHVWDRQDSRTGWRRCIGCLKLQLPFHKRATKYRAFWRETTSKNKAWYDSLE